MDKDPQLPPSFHLWLQDRLASIPGRNCITSAGLWKQEDAGRMHTSMFKTAEKIQDDSMYLYCPYMHTPSQHSSLHISPHTPPPASTLEAFPGYIHVQEGILDHSISWNKIQIHQGRRYVKVRVCLLQNEHFTKLMLFKFHAVTQNK